MTSEKKTEANRQNALRSTVPRTPEGKAAASQNALRHGIRSQRVRFPLARGGHVPAPVALDVDVSGITEGDR
jgi:hypothetical protein